MDLCEIGLGKSFPGTKSWISRVSLASPSASGGGARMSKADAVGGARRSIAELFCKCVGSRAGSEPFSSPRSRALLFDTTIDWTWGFRCSPSTVDADWAWWRWFISGGADVLREGKIGLVLERFNIFPRACAGDTALVKLGSAAATGESPRMEFCCKREGRAVRKRVHFTKQLERN